MNLYLKTTDNRINSLLTLMLYIVAMIGLVSGIMAILFKKETIYAVVALAVWLMLVLFCLKDFKERILLLLLAVTLFTFILGRPLIDFASGIDWIELTKVRYGANAMPQLTMLLFIISVLSMLIGAWLSANSVERTRIIKPKLNIDGLEFLRLVSFGVYVVTYAFAAARGVEKVLFRLNHTYLEYYTDFHSKLPYFTYILASFCTYSMSFYLAALPSKPGAIAVLASNVLLHLCDLIVGSRGGFVISLLFCIFYFVFRDYCDSKTRWFGKFEKLCLIGITIPGMAFLAFYNTYRIGTAVTNLKISKAIYDFFYSQGVTFSWVSLGLGNTARLPNHINYSFSNVIDYFLYGNLGQVLLGTKAMPSGNNITIATEGNSLAHHLSYIVFGNGYLQGHGTGTSFLLENYLDFGVIGVILFSLLLGFFSIKMIRYAKHSYFPAVLCLTMFNGFVYIPRNEFSQIFSFLVYIKFWLIACSIFVLAAIINDRWIKKNADIHGIQ